MVIAMGSVMIPEAHSLVLIDGGVHIPRRKKSGSVESKKEDEGASISMVEAAKILLAMANGGFCERKRKKSPTVKQSKKSPTAKQRKKSPSEKQRKKSMELEESFPEMPASMRDRIVGNGGYEIQLVIQKQLEESDVSRNHGRLCLPATKVKTEFVREEERNILEEENNGKKKNKKGLEVGVMGDDLRESSMCLKKWKIGSGKFYCLMKNWNCFVEENGLRSGDYIQLWSFRNNNISDQLCFAIVKHLHVV
ncbi:putative B3 domain-containing protein [Cucumis melo var. makuwa]|uniref:B3 domain-containing protein n=2 Tax=Cucumis melo TaxID=3656 RepID=A0A5A7VC33_CUCMM|nr:putative B3 domain-containing protein [Cucumis melo var. makuwa]